MPRVQRNNNWNEVWGLVWVGAGLFLFLALISYSARDLPSWVFFAPSVRSSGPVGNLIGSVGAVVAGFCYWFIGAASFLLAISLLWFGVVKFCSSQSRIGLRSLWALLFLASAAALIDLQPWFLRDWKQEFNILGPGGWLGYWLGERLFERHLNGVGAAIVLVALYLIGLIRMTGLRPIALVRASIEAERRRREEAEKIQYEKANPIEKLEIERRRIERERERMQKELKKKKIPIREDEEVQEGSLVEEAAVPAPAGRRRKAQPMALPAPAPAPVPKPEPVPEPIVEREPEPEPEPVIVAKAEPPEESAPERGFFGLSAPKKKSKAEKTKKEKEERFSALPETPRPAGEGTYLLPGLNLLDQLDPSGEQGMTVSELDAMHDKIVETLGHFKVQVTKGDYTSGPTITRYELVPAQGVRVAKILEFERDLARATKAERINILAPIPGKDTVGIEIANSRKRKVTLRQILESEKWSDTRASIPLALGKDVYGNAIIADLAKAPHMLVAGTTGSGKSVCINSIIASILYRFTPKELQFVMIDPKVVEMQVYNDLPHLAMPVVTEPKRVLRALSWVVAEMERRYRIFAETGVRNITSFNNRPKDKKPDKAEEPQLELAGLNGEPPQPAGENGEEAGAASTDEILNGGPVQVSGPIQVPRDEEIIPDKLPFIVVIIDELADLMQTAPADVEAAIARITQMARAAGIHMIVATQTPRADVVTGVIKANIPTRIAFQVASKLDSRVILDANGADKLLGQGDMIYLPPGTAQQVRAQGVLVTDDEIKELVEFCRQQEEPDFQVDLDSIAERGAALDDGDDDDGLTDRDRELIERCMEIMRREKKASASMFQTRLRIGYPKAAFIMNWLEERNFVKPGQGAKHREVNVEMLGVAADE